MKRKHQDFKLNPAQKSPHQTGSYISDKKLTPRIKQYMRENSRKKHLSISSITEDLQKQYSEYSRKKKNAFQKLVEKAYSVACEQLEAEDGDCFNVAEESYLKKKRKDKTVSQSSDDSDDSEDDSKSFSSENQDYVNVEDSNAMNSLMTDFYKTSPLHSKSFDKAQDNKDRTLPPGSSKSLPKTPTSHHSWYIDRGTPGKVVGSADDDDMAVGDVTADIGTVSQDKDANASTCINKDKSLLQTPASKKSTNNEMTRNGKKKNKKKGDKQERKKKGPAIQTSNVTFRDIGGNDSTLEEVCKLLVHMKHPEVYRKLGVTPPRGFLLHGPPGCGKTLMALAREAAMTAVNRVFHELQKTSSPESATLEHESSHNETTIKTVTSNSTKVSTVLSWLRDQPPLTEQQLQDLYITMEDFQEALKHVQPSAKREGFATIPDVTWSDIGALHSVREELQLAILAPVRHQKKFESLGLTSPPGILLAGPPGCGKTLLAKAIANESGINFISVKGPELLNMYVGESERAVRQVFQRARNSFPCVIFFDELDALCPKRSGSGEGGASVRVVNQMLTEMDGLESRKQVFIMAATNRPDIIDPAILRPGRLDKLLYVGLPSEDDRLDILKTITKNGTKPRLGEDVSLSAVAGDARCEGFTGADLTSLVREASVTALKDVIKLPVTDPHAVIEVTALHFETAFIKVKPSVTKKDQEKYARMKDSLRS